ncbi:MAG: AI-2E family transporter [Candidatus Paceibacterota bacterium]|jgi:predicted PurR-regulated permease PerM
MEKDTNKLTINITPGSFLKGILIILLFWFLFYIKDVVLVVLTAVIIASGLEPFINWFKRFRIKRLPAAIISYVLIFSVFTGLMFTFIPAVLDEASTFLSTLPKYLDSATLWNPLNVTSKDIVVPQTVINSLSEGVNNPEQLVKDVSASQLKVTTAPTNFGISDLVKGVQEITSNVTDGFVKVLSVVFGGLLSFILIVVLSFYLIVQENGVTKFLGLITPIKHEKYVIDLWKRSQVKIGQWMQGQLLLGVLVGVLIYLGLVILGVRNALLFAVVAAALEIIPVFGPVISAIPPILLAFIDGGTTSALLVTGLFVIVQQFESHLIYPLVVKKIVGVSPIIVILALIIGAKLAGFLGIVLSVPIVSAMMEFFDDIERKKTLFWKKAEELEKI